MTHRFINSGAIEPLKTKQKILLTTFSEFRNKPYDFFRLESGEYAYIRPLTPKDIYALHKMYLSLSKESRSYFQPTFFQRKSFRWLFANFALLISTIIPLKKLLVCLFPRIIFTAVIALNDKKEIVALAYFKINHQYANRKYSASFATSVRNDYQGRGLGSKLTKNVIKMARRHKVSEISLWVSTKNVKAIGLYKKHGFKVVQLIKSSNYLKMSIQLH